MAAGETVTGPRRVSPGEAPAETPAEIARPDRPSDRPKTPELVEERVPGQAGAGFAQDVPVRSVAEVTAEAERRNKLEEDARHEEQLVHSELADAVAPEDILRPDPVGPEPLEPTTLKPGEGASAFGAAHTPLEGRVEGDQQPPLGEEPSE